MDGSTPVTTDPELDPLRELCAGEPERFTEGGLPFVFLPGLNFLVRGEPRQMDALLCLSFPNASYPTKMYFREKVQKPSGEALNWNESYYLRLANWETWSWRDVTPNQPLIGILAGHLKAFRS